MLQVDAVRRLIARLNKTPTCIGVDSFSIVAVYYGEDDIYEVDTAGIITHIKTARAKTVIMMEVEI